MKPQDQAEARLRAIPSMERVLSSGLIAPLIAEHGRERVKQALVAHLAVIRAGHAVWSLDEAAAAVRAELDASVRSSLRRVVNGSGIIIHTNLGRAPIDASIWDEAAELVTGWSNLEFDLEQGERGARDEHLTALCRTVFGCEAAILTNNNAAGTMLLVAAVAAGREVVVSRGELVEIGGAFRVPDVIRQGGAKLREVGTTNRTRARDYADAVSRKTAAMLRVHRSNFEIVGFTETPPLGELVEAASSKRVPLLYDEGSGCVVDLAAYGFQPKETISTLFASGVDAITCSTDKLIGATQGGLILGRRDLVEACRRHPLMRAVRAGKESYAVIAATLRAFATGRHEQRVPVYRMLAATMDALRERAAAVVEGTGCLVVESRCALGGGTTPTETIPSIAIDVPGHASELHARFLRNDPPIVGRIQNDRFTIEVRTLQERDLAVVRAAIATLAG